MKKKTDEGNTDVKKQIESDVNDRRSIYQLVNVKTGGGKLIEIIKARARYQSQTTSSESFSGIKDKKSSLDSLMRQQSMTDQQRLEHDRRVDSQIREFVEPLLYNGGRGKLVPLERIWYSRIRGERCNEFSSCEESTTQGLESNSRLDDQQDGRLRSGEIIDGRAHRWVCWKLEERGFVGETALHICFLLSTPSHMILAQKLLRLFPMLINDIYTCDEYFGESSLHMAIVNEDVKIVKLLLDHGANVHERCLGSFFLPNDQKDKANSQIRRALGRYDARKFTRDEHNEFIWKILKDFERQQIGKGQQIDLHSNQFNDLQTNYEGYTYWGEYPLSFAASLGLADCYKLLLAKGANPNRQDSNGNSTLHICVLANRVDMFNLCYSNGANLNSLNKLGFNPLTLAAKFRRVQMFFHIMAVMRQVNWLFCNVGFVDIPLDGIDSISTRDGSCDDHSVLSIVVSGDSNEHLKMLDGLLSDLLQIKWETSIRQKFYTWFLLFIVLLVVANLAYMTRYNFVPISLKRTTNNAARYYKSAKNFSELALILCVLYYLFILTKRSLIESNSGQQHARHNPRWGPMRILVQAPELIIFTLTCVLILLCIPVRLVLHLQEAEEFISAIAMFFLPMKLLFFCRGSKSLGSFIVMIYKILVNDVLCFVVFLVIFIVGFGQSFLLIFKTYKPEVANANDVNNITRATSYETKNYFESLVNEGDGYFFNFCDGFTTLHMMALNEFSWVVDEFSLTEFPNLARCFFCAYMVFVSILLINMLIAMLGKTYQDISSQPNENVRQWARALLTVERMCSRKSRLSMLDKYSHPMAANQVVGEQEQAIRQRCYSLTRAMSGTELVEISNMRQLKRENHENFLKMTKRQKQNHKSNVGN